MLNHTCMNNTKGPTVYTAHLYLSDAGGTLYTLRAYTEVLSKLISGINYSVHFYMFPLKQTGREESSKSPLELNGTSENEQKWYDGKEVRLLQAVKIHLTIPF